MTSGNAADVARLEDFETEERSFAWDEGDDSVAVFEQIDPEAERRDADARRVICPRRRVGDLGPTPRRQRGLSGGAHHAGERTGTDQLGQWRYGSRGGQVLGVPKDPGIDTTSPFRELQARARS